MSGDILQPINNIKTSINENDQILWECQASAKCYNQATEKLKEEIQRLNKEIARINEEINELEPQTEILASCYDVQGESLTLNQESLINQRLYKKCINENIKKYQNEVNHTTMKYSQYFQICKKKLEITNPIYKSLQTKNMELKKCKIRCLDLTKKIKDLKKNNKLRLDFKQKLFKGDIIVFAQAWLMQKKILDATNTFNKEKQKEREYMRKLFEVTELSRQKQKEGCYRKEVTFKIPQIEFTKNDLSKNSKDTVEKAKKGNDFADLKTLLEKKDLSLADSARNIHSQKFDNIMNPHKLEFNANNSKIRVLENKRLNPPQITEKPLLGQSKEERSKLITEKLQKVVQNFNKTISRQSSKKQINSILHKPSRNEGVSIPNKNASQDKNSATKTDYVNVKESGATQELNLLSQESNGSSQMSAVHCQSFPNTPLSQQINFVAKMEYSNFPPKPLNQFEINTLSQESKLHPKPTLTSSINTFIPTVKNVTFTEKNKAVEGNARPSDTSNQKSGNNLCSDKSQFFLSSGTGGAFNMNSKIKENHQQTKADTAEQGNVLFKVPESNRSEHTKTGFDNIILQPGGTLLKTKIGDDTSTLQFVMDKPGDQLHKAVNKPQAPITQRGNENKDPVENPSVNNTNFTRMGGTFSYNFGNDTQFSQILNESYEYDGNYASPEVDQNYVMSPPGNDNMPMNFENSSIFPNQLFSFGQSNNLFSFK